jgi:hypothetical protein
VFKNATCLCHLQLVVHIKYLHCGEWIFLVEDGGKDVGLQVIVDKS